MNLPLNLKSGLAALFLLGSAAAQAAPGMLNIDQSINGKTSDKYIRVVHQEIPAEGRSAPELRLGILQGMINTKGFSWVYDGEGDGYIMARFDYRGDVVLLRIEYDDKYVQIKHEKSSNDLVCTKPVDGICYKADKSYYKYIKNLRLSIVNELNKV
ncbi:hypothetical protein [Shewanella khirikhana]|uniref:Uncharacterized protein n=1 Tax=Shewanella khirikhana TaxID=1965282 RepID=A0ABM7DPU2_9GAMM|nr:hypothetical protein [Shewanella khirikhana]AZQ11699.1 hypothetical protein STH12_02630 [Shewanella khirikhana]